jgi:autotransporter-associated beta strand protein
MLLRFIRLATLMVAMSLFATAAPRAVAQSATVVAVTGQVAPNTSANAFETFNQPVINDNGQVAFLGNLTGAQGIFLSLPPATGGNGQNANIPNNPGTIANNYVIQVALSGAPANAIGLPAIYNDPITGKPQAFYSVFDPKVALTDGGIGGSASSGQVAFRATVNDGHLDGIFAIPPGNLSTQGMQAGLTQATVLGAPAGTTWGGIPAPAPGQNNNGFVAFGATLGDGTQGIFAGQVPTGTAQQQVPMSILAQDQQLANIPASAGIPGGTTATFVGFFNSVPLSNNVNPLVVFQANTSVASGIFAWRSDFPTPPSDPNNHVAYIAASGGVAPVPAGFAAAVYRSSTTSPVAAFDDPATFTVNDFNGGTVIFKANTTGPGAGDSGIFSWTPAGGTKIVAYTRTNAPLSTPGNATQIAYSVLYPNGVYPPGDPNNPANTPVHYVDFPGPIATNVVLPTSGSPYSAVAFAATLTPAGGGAVYLAKDTGTGSFNIFPVAMSGNPAPGAGPGVNYGGFFTGDPSTSPIGLNRHAAPAPIGNVGPMNPSDGSPSPEIAYLASLSGNGVNASNNVGLFLANDYILDPVNNPHVTETAMLVRTGQFIQVSPGVTKQITGLNFFSTTGIGSNSLNDWGQLAVNVTFGADNTITQGVYVFTPDLHLRANVAAGSTVSWGIPSTTGTQQPNSSWTFGYNPADQIYKVVINAGDLAGATNATTVTVNGPTIDRAAAALQVGGSVGISTLNLTANTTLWLGTGVNLTPPGQAPTSLRTDGLLADPVVLTVQGPSSIVVNGGGTATLKLLGDVRSLAANGLTGAIETAVVNANVNLGFVPTQLPPPFPTNQNPPPPSTLDTDRFRVFNVDRGNFVGTNPIDMQINGALTSDNGVVASNVFTLPHTQFTQGDIITDNIGRGLWKTGPGTLQLTGANTFGPNTAMTTQTYQDFATNLTTTFTDTYLQGPFIQSIKVTGGTLGVSQDANLGLSPGPVTATNPYRVRWITLDGGPLQSLGNFLTQPDGTLQFTGSFTLDPNRGIALGPVSGAGFGVIQVTAGNTVTYGGVISDNTDGVTRGVGTFVFEGAGTLVLTGVNTFRGGTIVKPGTLIVSSDAALGAAGTPVQVLANDVLIYNGNSTTSRPFTLSGGTLAVAAGATLTLSNATITGGTIAGPGGFATLAGHSASFSGGAIGQSGSLTLQGLDSISSFTNAGQISIATGAISARLSQVVNQGSGAITVQPQGTLTVLDFQSNGTLTIAPATVTENFSQTTLMTNTGFTQLAFNAGSRTFIGTPQTAVFPANWPDASLRGLPTFVAGIDLHGQNATVAGGLFVNNGYVEDSTNNFQGTATVIADFGSLVKGAGYYQNAVQTINGGKFQAGNSPGSASFGKLVLGPGGVNNYVMAINDATGTAGPTPDAAGHVSGWGLIKSVTAGPNGNGPLTSGDFTWTATPTDKLTFAIDTLLNPTTVGNDVIGPMADFDPNHPYSWLAVSWAGVYLGPTDDATLNASTAFDTTGFMNQVAGAFGWDLNTGDHTLSLTYTPSAVPEPGTLALVGFAAAVGWRSRRRFVRRSP